jgi:hypothetical protein
MLGSRFRTPKPLLRIHKMPKAEISWTRHTPEGEKLQVYVHHVGNRWLFHARSRRYDPWQSVEHPPLEDWLELLDAVRRRAARRLLRPEEIDRVKKSILARFPEAEC